MDPTLQILWFSLWISLLAVAIVVFRFPGRDRKITPRIDEQTSSRSPTAALGRGVTEVDTAQAMLERIRSLASVLFGYDSPPLEVQLSSPQELQTLYSTRFGLNTQPQACYTDESDHPRILVQQGLPEEALFVVLAHEFGHAWQANEGFSGGSVEQREGFAQWVAYRISEADGRDAQTLFESCTGLEASGLRKFISLEEKFGLVGVLKAAKSKNLNLKVLR